MVGVIDKMLVMAVKDKLLQTAGIDNFLLVFLGNGVQSLCDDSLFLSHSECGCV